jgi:hypothetical protein
MNSPAGEPQGPKRTPLPNPLPVRRGEGEATPRSLSGLIQRQCGLGQGDFWHGLHGFGGIGMGKPALRCFR